MKRFVCALVVCLALAATPAAGILAGFAVHNNRLGARVRR